MLSGHPLIGAAVMAGKSLFKGDLGPIASFLSKDVDEAAHNIDHFINMTEVSHKIPKQQTAENLIVRFKSIANDANTTAETRKQARAMIKHLKEYSMPLSSRALIGGTAGNLNDLLGISNKESQ